MFYQCSTLSKMSQNTSPERALPFVKVAHAEAGHSNGFMSSIKYASWTKWWKLQARRKASSMWQVMRQKLGISASWKSDFQIQICFLIILLFFFHLQDCGCPGRRGVASRAVANASTYHLHAANTSPNAQVEYGESWTWEAVQASPPASSLALRRLEELLHVSELYIAFVLYSFLGLFGSNLQS